MLRASVEATAQAVDARAVTDVGVDPLLPGGSELLAFVDAVLEDSGVHVARQALADALGEEALVDAAGVIATFEMMNRVAEGTGIPVGKGSLARSAEWRAHLGLDVFRHG